MKEREEKRASIINGMVFVVERRQEEGKCCLVGFFLYLLSVDTAHRHSGAERAGSGLGLLLICFVMLVVSGLAF